MVHKAFHDRKGTLTWGREGEEVAAIHKWWPVTVRYVSPQHMLVEHLPTIFKALVLGLASSLDDGADLATVLGAVWQSSTFDNLQRAQIEGSVRLCIVGAPARRAPDESEAGSY
jgi:hypothetical protein